MDTLAHKIKQSESILRSIINSALDAVIVIDENGCITEWNHQAEKTFGWTREWALGKKLSNTIIPIEFREAHERGMKHFLATGEGPVLNKRIEIVAVNKGGIQFPVELTIIPNKVDDVYFFSSFVRDLTEVKKTEQTLQTIHELAISLLGKNSLEEIAWEITQKTIEKLGLVDCVIYVIDETDGLLHQVAAYGPKNPKSKQIVNKISLEIGKSIVGKAALLKEPVIVSDASKDPDYYMDDEFRYSELAVPILFEGKVLGVIDSEHPDKDFFKKEHLDVFTTIASITSSKIKSAINVKRREEAEKSLKESEERWQNLVENMPEALQISKKGKVVYVNPAGLRVYEAEELTQLQGANLWELARNIDQSVFDERLELLRRYGFVEPLEFEIETLKGSIKYLEANSTSIIYDGEVAIQSVLRDITEKKKAELEMKKLSFRLSTLLDNLNTGILMEQADRTVVHANKKFCELFGNLFEPEQLMGQDCGLLLNEAKQFFKDPVKFEVSTNKLVKERERFVNEELELSNGKILERDFIPIIFDGIQYGTVWQYREITERKKTEENLRRALDSERSYNDLNRNFVSMVSHEFRTPLTSIHSTSELILQFIERFSKEDIEKRVGRIYKSSERMEQLIQNVLTIGKLDATTELTNIEEIRISDIIKELTNGLEIAEIKNRNILFSGFENEQTIYTDRSLMELTIRNILENSGKYSDPGSPIEISSSIKQNWLELSFKDYGIGIPKDELNLVFESFKRASNTEGVKGTGLGLPIVKKSVEKLGGSISIESEVNKGTQIFVQLPVNTLPIS